jgi:2-dehydropantoate 2-reductase
MTTNAEPILVAGAGALGSVFGGFLRRAGWPVTLLGRPPHLAAIAERGLRIVGLWGEHTVSGFTLAADVHSLAGPFRAVLLTVKSYDTASVASLIGPCLASDGVVISLQNGLGNVEEAARAVGLGRVVGGRVIFGAVLVEPGRVQVTVCAEPVMLGSPEPRRYPALDAAAERWVRAFAEAGIPCEYSCEITAHLWSKVLYNAALNPLGALLGLPYGALAANPDVRALMDGIIDEAYAVALARRVKLPWSSAVAYREEFYGRLVPTTAAHRSSMLQDVERHRPTEIDAINGRVCEYGRAGGVPTPINEAVMRLVRAKARAMGW